MNKGLPQKQWAKEEAKHVKTEGALRRVAPACFKDNETNLAKISECESFLAKFGIMESVLHSAAKYAAETNAVNPQLKTGFH